MISKFSSAELNALADRLDNEEDGLWRYLPDCDKVEALNAARELREYAAIKSASAGVVTDAMWDSIAGDRDAITEALRIVVKQTKRGIRDRINAG